MDLAAIAGFAVVVVGALLHLERRLSRIERDVAWLRAAHEHNPES